MNINQLENSIEYIYHWTHISSFVNILKDKKIKFRGEKHGNNFCMPSNPNVVYISTSFEASETYFKENHSCGGVAKIGGCRISLRKNDYIKNLILNNFTIDEDIVWFFLQYDSLFFTMEELIENFEQQFIKIENLINNKELFKKYIINLYKELKLEKQNIKKEEIGKLSFDDDFYKHYNSKVNAFHSTNQNNLLNLLKDKPPGISFNEEIDLTNFKADEISIEYRFEKKDSGFSHSIARPQKDYISILYDEYDIEKRMLNAENIQLGKH